MPSLLWGSVFTTHCSLQNQRSWVALHFSFQISCGSFPSCVGGVSVLRPLGRFCLCPPVLPDAKDHTLFQSFWWRRFCANHKQSLLLTFYYIFGNRLEAVNLWYDYAGVFARTINRALVPDGVQTIIFMAHLSDLFIYLDYINTHPYNTHTVVVLHRLSEFLAHPHFVHTDGTWVTLLNPGPIAAKVAAYIAAHPVPAFSLTDLPAVLFDLASQVGLRMADASSLDGELLSSLADESSLDHHDALSGTHHSAGGASGASSYSWGWGRLDNHHGHP